MFVLVFLHVESRWAYLTPATYNPDEAWVRQNELLVPTPVKKRRQRTPRASPPPDFSQVRCQQQLGGLLKHYYRKAG